MKTDALHVRPLAERPDEERGEGGGSDQTADQSADSTDNAELGEDDDADEGGAQITVWFPINEPAALSDKLT